MAPRFRIYGKKRGHRRTGSKVLASILEAIFFTAIVLIGLAGLVLIFIRLVIPEWRANHVFVDHQCVVLDKRLARKETAERNLYRPEIRIEYQVRGATYVAWTYDIRHDFSTGEEEKQAILDDFVPGQTYPCWYDPSDPNVVVLIRGYSWWFWLLLMVPVSFLLIGSGGLIYTVLTWGTSAERRAVMARRAARMKLFEDSQQAKPEYPQVPSPENITNSPGTRLAYRLPIGVSPGWKVMVWLIACLVWNGIVAVFVIWAINGHIAGNPDWFLTIFITPFALAGIGLVVVLVRQLLIATGVGPTLIEISDQPLCPGGRYDLVLLQTGRLKMNWLEVYLVCDEEATFRHGTDTRRESHRVYQQRVFRQEGFQIQRGEPFEARFAVEMPAGAMHTFKSDHNEVNWKVIVKGDVADWPGYERSFQVIVYPGSTVSRINGTSRA